MVIITNTVIVQLENVPNNDFDKGTITFEENEDTQIVG